MYIVIPIYSVKVMLHKMIPNNNCWFSHDVIKIQYFVMKPSHLSPYIYMVNGTVTRSNNK